MVKVILWVTVVAKNYSVCTAHNYALLWPQQSSNDNIEGQDKSILTFYYTSVIYFIQFSYTVYFRYSHK